MSRFLSLGSYFAIQDFLSGWFHGAPFDQIHRENCVAFVAYAFYNRGYDDLPARVGLATVLFASTSFTRSLGRLLAHSLLLFLPTNLHTSLCGTLLYYFVLLPHTSASCSVFLAVTEAASEYNHAAQDSSGPSVLRCVLLSCWLCEFTYVDRHRKQPSALLTMSRSITMCSSHQEPMPTLVSWRTLGSL